jgi:hypothetical protein
VAARRRDPEAERVLAQRQANLTALTQHPSWPELQAEVGRKRARIEKTVTVKVFGGREPVDPIEMAFWRGFVEGMEWFAGVPEVAEARFERYLRDRGVGATEGVT